MTSGNGAPKTADRRREDHAWTAGGATQGIEQGAGAIDVDPRALVEVRLGLARHHTGQVEYHVGLASDELSSGSGVDQVGDNAFLARGTSRCRHDVHQIHRIDRLVAEQAVGPQAVRQLSADHPGGARDQDAHQPRPTKGIALAITVMVNTLASAGRLAMYATARPTLSTAIVGSGLMAPSACAAPWCT